MGRCERGREARIIKKKRAPPPENKRPAALNGHCGVSNAAMRWPDKPWPWQMIAATWPSRMFGGVKKSHYIPCPFIIAQQAWLLKYTRGFGPTSFSSCVRASVPIFLRALNLLLSYELIIHALAKFGRKKFARNQNLCVLLLGNFHAAQTLKFASRATLTPNSQRLRKREELFPRGDLRQPLICIFRA